MTAGAPVTTCPALVVPADVDGPRGGNVWDRRVRQELIARGCDPGWFPVRGSWPEPAPHDATALDEVLAGIPDGRPVLLDGVVACGVPDVVVPHTRRLRTGVVVHLPLARETGIDPDRARRLAAAEEQVLTAVDVVVVPSQWTAAELSGLRLRREPVVALPGTDRPPSSGGAPDVALRPDRGGAHLLFLGALTPRKGPRVLLRALERAQAGLHPQWLARFVGPHPDPVEAALLLSERDRAGLGDRVDVVGPLVGEALEEQWRWADLLVVPSILETFGMVVTEALVRGVPVLGTTGSAVPEALGTTGTGPPGLLVPPDDVDALQAALVEWSNDRALRAELTRRAVERGAQVTGWDATADAVAGAFR